MSILTQSGRVALAESIAARPLYLAWGAGDGLWGAPPNESVSSTGLMSEIGRRLITGVKFATIGGGVVLGSSSFTVSDTPSDSIYVKVDFDFLDAPTSVIREVAIFVEPTLVTGLPVGQRYFLPAQVASPGRLLMLQNIAPIFRVSTNREHFEFVIEF